MSESAANGSGAWVLWRHAEPERARDDGEPPPEAVELAARLAGEPMALRLLGRLVREHPLSVGGYAGMQRQLESTGGAGGPQTSALDAPLESVCVLSMTQLDQQRLTRARPLLALLSFLGADGVPVPLRRLDGEALRRTVVDPNGDPVGVAELELAVGMLAAHGFVSRGFVDGAAVVTLDPTVTGVIRERLGSSALEVAASASVVLARGTGSDVAMEDAAYRAVLEVRTGRLGDHHPDTLWTRHRLADLAARRGDLAAADAAYREVHQAQSAALGAEHPDTLWTRNRLADLAARRGDLGAADAAYREVLQAQERVLGQEHPYTRLTRAALTAVNRTESTS